jgi:NADPH-dependent glutamate synthase beta subunit-like oxidoreductase
VYLAVGAQRPKRLRELDYTRSWALDGADYLARVNAGAEVALGRCVVVIGGGSAALDVARSAQRAGHEVTILALESRSQMPAQAEEVIQALEEGITLIDGARLDEVCDTGGADRVLLCTRVHFTPGARRGEFTVTPVAGSEFVLLADSIIASVGQDPELAPLAGALAMDGTLLKADSRQATSEERVYAGGDAASMARFVTEAIGMGKRAAREIDRALRGNSTQGATAPEEPIVGLAAINLSYHPGQARAVEARLPAAQRLAGAEVELGFDMELALAEGARCFSCGTCITCDNCVVYCPDLAVTREGDGYRVLFDYCKGCGLCVKECPTGSMKMIQDER